jgi:hypothetical protein
LHSIHVDGELKLSVLTAGNNKWKAKDMSRGGALHVAEPDSLLAALVF